MILKDNVLGLIRQDKFLKRELEDKLERSFYTIEEYIKLNDPKLCRHDILMLIAAHLKMQVDDLYIMQESDFKEVV